MSYLPCELHCHSVHSDGSFSVAELLRRAYDDHLALIALTDHNTVSGHGELDDSITPAVPGIEWTTFFGHMLVLGAKEAEAGNISVRDRKGETTEMNLEDFIAKVTTEIRTRSL